VSRSEEDGTLDESEELSSSNDESKPRPRRDEVEFNELSIKLKISYKTLVFAFVLFDVLRKSIDVLGDSDTIQNFLGG